MTIDSDNDLKALKRVGAVVAEILDVLEAAARPGTTTNKLDAIAGEILATHGARSAPKLAYGFPANICIGVNDAAVHGIPDDEPLRTTDLLKIDVTVELDGYIADAARSVPLPGATKTKRRLAACAASALDAALGAASHGVGLRDLGATVESVVGRHGFTVLTELGGHGVGRRIHEPPHVSNWADPNAKGRLHEGLVIAIEPIIAAGAKTVFEDGDGWTLRTSDGSPSAHAEHTIVVTNGSPIVLTAAVA